MATLPDLDHTPIVIRGSRVKKIVILTLCSAFAIAGAILILVVDEPEAGWPALLLFGTGAIATGLRLVAADRIILTPDALTQEVLFRKKAWRWSEVRDFRPFGTDTVAFDFLDPKRGSFSHAVAGAGDCLAGQFTLDAAALSDLLNAARTRWAGTPP